MTIDPAQFKELFSNWPAAVAVITCRGIDGQPRGFTASSFDPLSLNPPLVLFTLARQAGSLPHFEAAPGFAVNALAAGQEELSARFAGPEPDRFAGLEYTFGETGAPLLKDAWARVECRTRHRYDGGDHVLFVGEIVSLDFSAAEPLVYHRRRYRRVTG
ncbi:MAG: flavin reductase family protein [Firmicutes bacterium]|nr:flavin reductase family protein [Bacillota bacterium]